MALSVLPVSMYGVLKRLILVTVLVSERLVLNIRNSRFVVLATVVTFVGAVMAALGDLTFNGRGYALAFASVFAQTASMLYVKFTTKSYARARARVCAHAAADTARWWGRLSVFGALFYNSLLGIPIVALVLVGTGELQRVLAYERFGEPGFVLAFVFTIVFAVLLHFTMYMCTRLASPLTTCIVGQAKAGLTTLLAALLFGVAEYSVLNAAGVVINIVGGMGYGFLKFFEKEQKHAKHDDGTAPAPAQLAGDSKPDAGLHLGRDQLGSIAGSTLSLSSIAAGAAQQGAAGAPHYARDNAHSRMRGAAENV